MSWFNSKKSLTKDEMYVRDIIIEYIKNPSVVKEIAPSSDTYYLTNAESEIYIKLGHSDVQITNHRFFYKKAFALSFIERLKKMVKDKIEEEKKEFEKQIFSNEVELLRNIFKTVEVND